MRIGRISATSFTHFRTAGCLAALVLASGVAQAQSEPRPISGLASAISLSDEDRASIVAYAEYWVARLAGATDPDDQVDAAGKVLDPLRARGTSLQFRTEYGLAAAPKLRELIRADTSPFATTNALLAVTLLGNESALDLLIEFVAGREARAMHVRLAAARGCRDLFEKTDGDSDAISARKISTAVRRLREAVAVESNPLVLRHQLSAIFAADAKALPIESRTQVYGYLAEALEIVAQRGGKDPQLLTASSPVVLELLQEYVRFAPDVQGPIGQKIVPGLIAMLAGYDGAWASAGSEGALRPQLAAQIQRIENCLKVTYPVAHPGRQAPEAGLADSFRKGDQARFREGLQRWTQLK